MSDRSGSSEFVDTNQTIPLIQQSADEEDQFENTEDCSECGIATTSSNVPTGLAHNTVYNVENERSPSISPIDTRFLKQDSPIDTKFQINDETRRSGSRTSNRTSEDGEASSNSQILDTVYHMAENLAIDTRIISEDELILHTTNRRGSNEHELGLHIQHRTAAPHSECDTSTPDVNVYQQKKTLAQGMMDLALLSANATQLRYILESNSRSSYYYPALACTSASIILQVLVGIGLIMNSQYNVSKDDHIHIADKINNLTVVGIFLITVVNVFSSVFGVAVQ